MRIAPLDTADDDLTGRVIDLMLAVRDADYPENPRPVDPHLRAWFRAEYPGREHHHFIAADGPDLVGYLGIGLLTDDNPHLAMAELLVHPAHRRRGHGTALLRRYLDFAAGAGRTNLIAGTRTAWGDGPRRSDTGARFLERNGFALALVNVSHRCRTDALDSGTEARLWDRAREAAGDYAVRTWTGPAPDDLVESLCRLGAMAGTEIPTGDVEIEPETADVDRYRAKEAALAAVRQIPVRAAAVHRATGAVAALTHVRAYADPAEHAVQGVTIADPDHRGHRLGLLVKLANLRQLRERFPAVAALWTENADVNDRMIAINNALGYEAVDAVGVYQRRLGA